MKKQLFRNITHLAIVFWEMFWFISELNGISNCGVICYLMQLGRLFQMLEGLGTEIEKDELLDKYRKPESNAAYMQEWSSLTKEFVKVLPYSLTSSQLKAVSEIIWDLRQPVPMNRLLQV